MKKKVIAALVATMMFGSTLTVDAAGLKDIFSAEYYAGQYQDLQDAFGNDEDALYEHFLEYGLEEGRVMNPIIDVAKYRKEYADLEAAFGDDWDAYVNHFFEYGIEENRENGTDFDIKAYVIAYGDIKEAFGDDYEAIAKHYAEYGIKENRVEASKTVIAEKEEAKKQEVSKPVPSPEEERLNGVYTDYHNDGSWNVMEYQDGKLIGEECYTAKGELSVYITYEYDEKGRILLNIWYNADGTVGSTIEYTYNADGSGLKTQTQGFDGSYDVEEFDAEGETTAKTFYNADGRCTGKSEYVDGRNTTSIFYDENGDVWMTSECTYDASGNLMYCWYNRVDGTRDVLYYEGGRTTKDIWYYTDGRYWVRLFASGERYNRVARETMYDSTDAIIEDVVYEFDVVTGEAFGYKVYDGDGNLIEEVVY